LSAALIMQHSTQKGGKVGLPDAAAEFLRAAAQVSQDVEQLDQ